MSKGAVQYNAERYVLKAFIWLELSLTSFTKTLVIAAVHVTTLRAISQNIAISHGVTRSGVVPVPEAQLRHP